MSIGAKPWEGGGAATVPDASETTKGKIRIATSTEAATGTDDLTAMTPLTVKERIDAALVGGVEYKGSYTGQSLVTAEQGDMYISAATYSLAGVSLLSGDHIIFNQDAADPVTSAMFDKIDNTDAVSSVNTLTGAVVLSGDDIAADHSASNYTPANANIDGHLSGIDSALASVGGNQITLIDNKVTSFTAASNAVYEIVSSLTVTMPSSPNEGDLIGFYAQANATPSLTVSGTIETINNVQTTSTTIEVNKRNVVWWGYDGARWQQLNDSIKVATVALAGVLETASNAEATAASATDKALTPSNIGFIDVGDLNDDATYQLRDAGLTSIAGLTTSADQMIYATASDTYAVTDLTAAGRALLDDADATAQRTTLGLGTAATSDTGDFLASTAALNDLSDVTISSVSNGQVISYNSTSGEWENSTPASGGATDLDGLSDVTITSAAGGNLLENNGSGQFVNVAKSTINVGDFNDDATYQLRDAGLTSISGLTTAADKMIYTTASDTYAVTGLTSAGRALLDDADAAAQRTTLGLGTAATSASTDFQPIDAGLTSISGLTTSADKMIYTTASDTYAVADLTSAGRALLDDADAAAQRTTLGLGTAATSASSDFLASTAGINDLSDVTITSVTNGQVISYNSTSGEWENSTPASGGATDLDGLSDVTITSASSGQILRNNGSGQFVNVALSIVDDTSPQLGGALDVNGNAITSASNGNVTINPDGTGDISVGADIIPDADATHTIGDEDNRFISLYSDVNGALRFKAKNDEGAQITKGQVVYIKGIAGDGETPTVGLADADDASKMPAFGLAFNTANDQAEIQIVSVGNLYGLNTSTFSVGDTLYVDTTAGGLVNTKPTGETAQLQNIGRVIRSNNGAGVIMVGGAGRSAATPNLDNGKIFLGNGSNQAVSTALSSAAVTSFNTQTGALTIGGDDLTADHTAVNYTAANANIDGHFSGIDSALALKAPLASPSLTGTPTAPTATQGDNSTQLATTAYVDTAVAGGGGGTSYTYSAITAGTTTAQAWYHYSVDTSSGAVTLNLPALSGLTDGDEIRVKLRDATNSVTIDANASENIDGSLTYTLDVAYQAVTLVVGSTEWEII